MKDTVRINPVTTTAFVLFHAVAIVALFFFSWRMLLLGAGMLILSGCPGIGIGFHRLLSSLVTPFPQKTPGR
jgi:stearoyl-CoA desaturase (delta-9 desaturase)